VKYSNQLNKLLQNPETPIDEITEKIKQQLPDNFYPATHPILYGVSITTIHQLNLAIEALNVYTAVAQELITSTAEQQEQMIKTILSMVPVSPNDSEVLQATLTGIISSIWTWFDEVEMRPQDTVTMVEMLIATQQPDEMILSAAALAAKQWLELDKQKQKKFNDLYKKLLTIRTSYQSAQQQGYTQTLEQYISTVEASSTSSDHSSDKGIPLTLNRLQQTILPYLTTKLDATTKQALAKTTYPSATPETTLGNLIATIIQKLLGQATQTPQTQTLITNLQAIPQAILNLPVIQTEEPLTDQKYQTQRELAAQYHYNQTLNRMELLIDKNLTPLERAITILREKDRPTISEMQWREKGRGALYDLAHDKLLKKEEGKETTSEKYADLGLRETLGITTEEEKELTTHLKQARHQVTLNPHHQGAGAILKTLAKQQAQQIIIDLIQQPQYSKNYHGFEIDDDDTDFLRKGGELIVEPPQDFVIEQPTPDYQALEKDYHARGNPLGHPYLITQSQPQIETLIRYHLQTVHSESVTMEQYPKAIIEIQKILGIQTTQDILSAIEPSLTDGRLSSWHIAIAKQQAQELLQKLPETPTVKLPVTIPQVQQLLKEIGLTLPTTEPTTETFPQQFLFRILDTLIAQLHKLTQWQKMQTEDLLINLLPGKLDHSKTQLVLETSLNDWHLTTTLKPEYGHFTLLPKGLDPIALYQIQTIDIYPNGDWVITGTKGSILYTPDNITQTHNQHWFKFLTGNEQKAMRRPGHPLSFHHPTKQGKFKVYPLPTTKQKLWPYVTQLSLNDLRIWADAEPPFFPKTMAYMTKANHLYLEDEHPAPGQPTKVYLIPELNVPDNIQGDPNPPISYTFVAQYPDFSYQIIFSSKLEDDHIRFNDLFIKIDQQITFDDTTAHFKKGSELLTYQQLGQGYLDYELQQKVTKKSIEQARAKKWSHLIDAVDPKWLENIETKTPLQLDTILEHVIDLAHKIPRTTSITDLTEAAKTEYYKSTGKPFFYSNQGWLTFFYFSSNELTDNQALHELSHLITMLGNVAEQDSDLKKAYQAFKTTVKDNAGKIAKKLNIAQEEYRKPNRSYWWGLRTKYKTIGRELTTQLVAEYLVWKTDPQNQYTPTRQFLKTKGLADIPNLATQLTTFLNQLTTSPKPKSKP